jgi:hypothetical protein
MVNTYKSKEMEIDHAGLPQGLPLLPFLFLFVNIILVDTPITKRRGAIIFVNNYTQWVVGSSTEANMAVLQCKVMPHILDWAVQSGTVFKAEKTLFIYFIRNQRQRQLPAVSLYIDRTAIALLTEVKILGMILDQILQFKLHIRKATSKGIKAILTLRWLYRLPPPIAQQLFISTVALKINYTASMWYSTEKDTIITPWIGQPFEAIQHIALQAIVRVFCTAALLIAKAEAGIKPTCIRLCSQIVNHWIACYTLLKDHPFWSSWMAAATQDRHYPLLFKVFAKHGLQCLSDLEVIQPFPLDP